MFQLLQMVGCVSVGKFVRLLLLVLIMLLAYLVRFMAAGFKAIDGAMHRVTPYDTASRREYHRCTLNGELMEADFKVPEKGPIGLEADRGLMEYRNLILRETP